MPAISTFQPPSVAGHQPSVACRDAPPRRKLGARPLPGLPMAAPRAKRTKASGLPLVAPVRRSVARRARAGADAAQAPIVLPPRTGVLLREVLAVAHATVSALAGLSGAVGLCAGYGALFTTGPMLDRWVTVAVAGAYLGFAFASAKAGVTTLTWAHRARNPLAYDTDTVYALKQCSASCRAGRLDEALAYLSTVGEHETLAGELAASVRATLAAYAACQGADDAVLRLTASGFDRARALPVLREMHRRLPEQVSESDGTRTVRNFEKVARNIIERGNGATSLEDGLAMVPLLARAAKHRPLKEIYAARQRKEINDRGVLLGLHAAARASDAWLDAPNMWALMRSRRVTRDDVTMRRALAAFDLLLREAPERRWRYESCNATRLALAWPDEDVTQNMIVDDWHKSHTAALLAVCAWQRGDDTRSQVREAVARARAAHDVLVQHATYVLTTGGGRRIRRYLPVLANLIVHQRSVVALLRPRLERKTSELHTLLARVSDIAPDGGALQVERLSKAIARCTRALADDARQSEAAAFAQQSVNALGSLLRLQATLARKPPAPRNDAPVSFWRHAGKHKDVARLYNAAVAPEQIRCLQGLGLLSQAGESASACASPADVWHKLTETCDVAPADREAFHALLRSFRQAGLFWVFMGVMRKHGDEHAAQSREALTSVLQGRYDAERRASPQMRELAHAPELLHAWEAGAREQARDWQGCTLEDTGTFVDFASSGDEISGSCQSLFSRSGAAYHLLARVRDGACRMLTIKAADGSIIARAVWRLMSAPHHDGMKAAALLSRVYVARAIDFQHGKATATLQAFAKRRAADLGIAAAASTRCFEPSETEGLQPCTLLMFETGPLADYWDERDPVVTDAVYL